MTRMSPHEDLSGKRFDRLLVKSFHGTDKFKRRIWLCKCDCGADCTAVGITLKAKTKRSCGCLGKEIRAKKATERRPDISGEKFGRLTVGERLRSDKNGQSIWMCLCDCGKSVEVSTHSLRSKNTQSCGCFFRDTIKNNKSGTTHGLSRLPNGKHRRLFKIWTGMKDRCFNEKAPAFSKYGKRGITVCDEWLDYTAFYAWAMSNGYHEPLTIERKNNDKGYSAENCKWITKGKQSLNRSTSVRYYYKGENKTLAEIVQGTGVSYQKAWARINNLGWELERALKVK